MQTSPVKLIRGRSDLAIHGARPAFSEPLHVGRPNVADQAKYLALLTGMLERRWLSNNGPLVQEFESRLAEYIGVKHVVAICNGTIALELAIRALRLEGEIIVPSFTFVATAHAAHWHGLTPVFADIDPETHCLDPQSVKSLITARTSAVIGVHLWGRAAPVQALERLCRDHGLKLLFDAAHAFGCSLGGRLVGSFGVCEVFSFHATKFLNSLEGGAVATNDDELAHTIRLMRNFGFAGYDNVILRGTNGKMVEACAAMGIVNLEDVASLIQTNRRNHVGYREGLSGIPGLRLFAFDEKEKNNWQYVVVEVGKGACMARDELLAALHAENVLARKYFWPGCHRMKPYRDLFPAADAHLPNTNSVAGSVIVLPTGSSIGPPEIEAICSIFRELQQSR
jgi:dTDP-4-amino-4,6-dideoxygalactose transaminase